MRTMIFVAPPKRGTGVSGDGKKIGYDLSGYRSVVARVMWKKSEKFYPTIVVYLSK
jgi:hypothetical protein